MSEIWFTSDHHFGHTNILEYEKYARPFDTINEMHEVMIERWNRVVGSGDTVFHLGDFCFGKHNLHLANRLNGKKKLILGNHDTYPSADYLRYFEKLYGVVFWRKCVLSHTPLHPSGLGSRWFLNVHGHLHSKVVSDLCTYANTADGKLFYEPDLNYFNVSVEQNNLTPFHESVIMERVKSLE